MKPTIRLVVIAVVAFLLCWVWQVRPRPNALYEVGYGFPMELSYSEILPTLFDLSAETPLGPTIVDFIAAFEQEAGLTFPEGSQFIFPPKNPFMPDFKGGDIRLKNTIANHRKLEKALRNAFPAADYPAYEPVVDRDLSQANRRWVVEAQDRSFGFQQRGYYAGTTFGIPQVRYHTRLFLGSKHTLLPWPLDIQEYTTSFRYSGPPWWSLYLIGLVILIFLYILRKPLGRAVFFWRKS